MAPGKAFSKAASPSVPSYYLNMYVEELEKGSEFGMQNNCMPLCSSDLL